MIRSFKDKMKVKQEAYQAEQERLAIIEEQKRKEREWELFDLEQKAIAEKNQQILAEEEARQHAEYVQWKQEQRILQEQQEQMPAKPIDTGIGMGHDATWKLTWMSFSTHPKIINLPMSEKVRLFKIAQSRENDRMNQPLVLGGGAPAVNYALQFTGVDEHNQSGRNDTARADLVTTQFTPNDPTNKGFEESSGRKPLAESGFTVSYWWRPDENRSDSFPIGWKRDDNGRFEFGISTHTKPYFSIGSSELKSKTWEAMFDDSGQGHLSGSLLDNGEGTAPGSGNKLILNKWYHIVATYAGTDNVDGDGNYLRKIYINGYHIYGGFGETKQSTNWNNFTAAQMTQGLSFGMRAVIASGNHTDGLRNTKYNNGNACALSEVAIYNEEKNAAWVSNVYSGKMDYNHKDSGGDGLVAYWKLDDGSGNTVKDSGPYGWHGTLTNAAYGTAIDGTTGNSSTIAGINARFPNATPTWIDHIDDYDH